MDFRHLRRFDVQARYAVITAMMAVLPCLGAGWLAWTRYNRDLGQIIYGAHGKFLPAFLSCLVASLFFGTSGFVLGWSSAGQRRNDQPIRSWIGFFVGGAVVTMSIILLIAFYLLRFPQQT